jgi:uncharacterized protein (TIGR00251 family)
MEIGEHKRGVILTVHVTPRANRDSMDGEYKGQGEHEGALKVRLTAPPVDDRANDALCKLLALNLKVPVSAVRILSGEKSRTKRVLIEGVTAARTRQLLGGAKA